MVNVIEMGLYISFFIILVFFAYSATHLLFVNYRMKKQIVQYEFEKQALMSRIRELIEDKEKANQPLENSEGFVRFMSQSRDMAFKYIEDVQQSIAELKDYFDKNGLNLSVDKAEEMAKRIEGVIDHLPEDSKND